MAMKLRTLASFPTSVVGSGGITISKSNGIWTIGQDIPAIASYVNSLNGFAPTSTDNAIVRFNGTTGGTQNSIPTISDVGTITINPTTGANKGLSLTQSASGAPAQDLNNTNGVGWGFNSIYATDTGIDTSAFSGGSQNAAGLYIQYLADSGATKTAVATVFGSFKLNHAFDAAHPSPNFQAGQFISSAVVDGQSAGALFGGGSAATLGALATNWENVSSWEFNAGIVTGGSSARFSVASLAATTTHAVDGTTYDTVLSISSQSNHGSSSGILFSDYNGQHPVAAGGTLIKTQGSKTVTGGIDLSSYTFTGNVFAGGGAFITGSGDLIANASSGISFNAQGGLRSSADGVFSVNNNANTSGVTFDITTNGKLKLRNLANSGDGQLSAGATALSGALTYGGVTLTNAVTGTGKMVLDTNPAITGGSVDNATIGSTTASTGKFTTVNATSAIQFSGTQVVGARDTGWTAMTGTPDKASTFATSTVTLVQLAERVMSIQAALTTHGLLGA